MRNGCTREWFVLVLAFLMLLAKSAVHSQNANEETCSLLNNETLCVCSPVIKLGSHMRSAMLTCSEMIDSQTGIVFGWYFKSLFEPERRIMNDSKYTITGDLNGILEVKNITVNDTGAYFCKRMMNGVVQGAMPVPGRCINVQSPALFSNCSEGESMFQVGCDTEIVIQGKEKESVEFNAFFVHQDESLSCDSQQVDDVSLFINNVDPDNKLCGCSGTSNDFSCTSGSDKRLDCSVHGGSNVTFTINNLTESDAGRYVVRATLRTENKAQEFNIFKNYSVQVITGCLPGLTWNGSTCTCNNGDVRLVNNLAGENRTTTEYVAQDRNATDQTTTLCKYDADLVEINNCQEEYSTVEGRVEICKNNTFGTVCDDRWDYVDSIVVCRKLGFITKDVVPIKRSPLVYGYDSMNLEIILSDLDCRGSESSLLECQVNVRNRDTNHCDHSEDAGVRCGAVCEESDVRLLVGEGFEYYYGGETLDSSYYIDDQLSIGRLELCLNGQWGVACQDYWNEEQASVVCSQLGFARVGAIAGNQRFQLTSSDELPVYNRSYSCKGSELHLSDCPSFEPNRTEPCGYRRNVYIVCQALSTIVSSCTTGDVRLQDGPNVREGRVEVCINNAWGIVCNEQFGVEDAIVTCKHMNFSMNDALIICDTLIPASLQTPIFLNGLRCDSATDTNILDCELASPLGIPKCSRDQDVIVHCEAFCSHELTNSTRGSYQWPVTTAEDILNFPCVYGALVDNGQSRRNCSDRGVWLKPQLDDCLTFSNSLLLNISKLSLPEGLDEVSIGLVNAINQAVNYEDQSEENLNLVLNIMRSIADYCRLDNCSLSSNHLVNIVRALDLLQSWRNEILQLQSARIAGYVEEIHSESARRLKLPLDEDIHKQTFLAETIVFREVKASKEYAEENGITYTADRNNAGIDFASDPIRNISDVDNSSVTIIVPPEVFNSSVLDGEEEISMVFAEYDSSVLYPLPPDSVLFTEENVTYTNFSVASTLLTATIVGHEDEIVDLETDVLITLKLNREYSKFVVTLCVFWNKTGGGGRGDWSSDGCSNATVNDELKDKNVVICNCSHLSTFGVFVNTNPVTCDSGFIPNPSFTACVDFHECEIDNGGCDQICINAVGDFHCNCSEGYVLNEDGYTCDDIDECLSDPCHSNATCNNTIGSFTCTCVSGFLGDGILCVDPITQPQTTRPPSVTAPTQPQSIELSTFYFILGILLITIFISTACILFICCYYIRKNRWVQGRCRIFCCLPKRVELSDADYELVDLPPPLPSPLHNRNTIESEDSGSIATAEANQAGSQTDPNFLTSVTSVTSVPTDESNSEKAEVQSPIYQVIDHLSPMLDNPLSTIMTVNSAYGTDVGTAPEILTEQNEAYERNEVTTSNNTIEFTASMSHEIKDSDIMQRENQPSLHFTLTANSAYGTDVGTAPEILTEENEAYERNEVSTSRDTSNIIEFTTSMSEIEDSDIMQRENQPGLHFTLTTNSAYGTDVATAPEILTEQNEAYERNEVTTSRDTNGTEFTTSMSEIEHSEIMQREYQPI